MEFFAHVILIVIGCDLHGHLSYLVWRRSHKKVVIRNIFVSSRFFSARHFPVNYANLYAIIYIITYFAIVKK